MVIHTQVAYTGCQSQHHIKYSDSFVGMWRSAESFNEESFGDYFSQLFPVNNVCNQWAQGLADCIFWD